MLEKYTIIKCTLAGIILGVAGTFLPLVMFSGEEQISVLINKFGEIGIIVLLLTGFIKLFITTSCNSLGLNGGHFFPNIFSGICLGYAFSLIIGINPIFCVCVITTALMAFLIKKPVAVVLLLMICFPPQAIPIMLLAAALGSFIKTPNFFTQKSI